MAGGRFLRVEFRVPIEDHGTLDACLEALVRQNIWQAKRIEAAGHRVPLLYQTHVVYRRDPPRKEWFRSLARCLRTGWGDCDDLAAWRAAEIRRGGGRAWARVRRTRNATLLHAVVVDKLGNIIEDPSEVLVTLGRADA